MKKALKISLYALAALAFIALAGVAYLKWALPNVGPAPELTVEITPERLERGEYLAYHVMLCMDCHAERDWSLFSGPPRPGTEGAGGDRFDHSMGFPGIFYARNITPFAISDWTDGELYRLITTGVRKDGEPIFPIMPYLNYGKMDEEDIKSVIAYIRTIEPIEASQPPSKADFPFNLIMRTLPAKASPQPMPLPIDQIAYGEYLVNAAACGDCHTRFEGGQFVGEYLAGGREFAFPDGSVLRSPNLTPHATGLESWTQETFVNRFKMYVDSAYVLPAVQPGELQSVMPWAMYAGMETADLEAIYAYLQTLAPVDHWVDRFVAAKGK